MSKFFIFSFLITLQSFAFSFENTNTIFIDQGDYAYPDGIQKHFENEMKKHQNIENLNIITSQWSTKVNLHLLSDLKKLKILNIQASGGWIFVDVISTLPHIPTLTHLGIRSYYLKKENFEKNDWIKSNPQLESLDLYDIYFEEDIDDPLAPLAQLINLKNLKLNIDFRNKKINFAALDLLPSLKSLKLVLKEKAKNEDLLTILNLSKLESLYLENSSNQDLHIIKKTIDQLKTSENLQFLFLKNLIIDSIDFSHYAKNLKHLTLDRVKLSGDWRWIQNNQKLEMLELFNIEFNVYNLEQINLASVPSIKIFHSNSCGGIDLSFFIPNVKELYLNGSNISPEDLQKLSLLHSLEILDISNTSIKGSSLKDLGSFQELKKIYAKNLTLRGGDVLELKRLASLEELFLSGSDLSLKQIENLGEFSSLKLLDLSNLANPNITPVEIEVLQKKLPATRIVF